MKLRCDAVSILSAILVLAGMLPLSLLAQSRQQNAVPNLVRFSGDALDGRGERIVGAVGVTFALYAHETGGPSLWRETQTVVADKDGHYSAALGLTSSEGIPTDLFTSGDAQWLGVQIQGQPEEHRILLLSVPYALKAKDSETLGGLPASAFALAGKQNAGTVTANPEVGTAITPNATPTGGGTTGSVALWTSASNLGNSNIVQTGTGSTAKVGVNTLAPVTTLDVAGATTLRGAVGLTPIAAATSAIGAYSQPLNLTASAFNSSTLAAVNQTFQWKAEPIANNTTSPAAKLNLLFGAGTATPAETGLKIAKNGLITFAAGQTFPGVSGGGTITGVTAGTGLAGGGTTGSVKLNVDATKVPFLATSNTFTQPQTINAVGIGLSANANVTAIVAKGTNGIIGVTTGTGGSVNGVLGQSVNATAVRGDDTGAGSGVVGTSSAGYGVYGVSTSGNGVTGVGGAVSGISSSASAVFGDSSAQNGVTGLSASGVGTIGINRKGNDGITAINQGSGMGLYAAAATVDKDYGVAIRAENFGTQVSSLGGPDGVQGITHSALGSGVVGINDALGGIGVYGLSSNSGFGFETPSNVSQGRGAGGWVKAMAVVNPFAPGA